MIKITTKDFVEKGENFQQKFNTALKDGFFYAEIPDSIKTKIQSVVEYTSQLRENDTLKHMNLGERLGYQERHGTQAVAFTATDHQWEQVFPDDVVQVANEMNHLALNILQTALQSLDIPQKHWSELTGKLSDGEGLNVLTLNNYKPCEQKIGLIPHKDMGWITVLFINKAGLESSNDGEIWSDVKVEDGYFVINFGRAFEILANSNKLKASLHRVRSLADERISFGVFANHTEGADLYEMIDKSFHRIGSYADYLNRCFIEFDQLQQQQLLLQ